MSKYVKELQIRDYRGRFGTADDVLFVNVVGLEATETNKLRLQLRKKGIGLQVVKNSLARKILEEKGLKVEPAILEGSSAVAWGGEDVVALARELADWAKKVEKFQIKGGCVGGQSLDSKGVDQLSKLPSRVEMLGQLVTLITSPGANLAAALLGAGGTLAGQIKQLAEPKEGEAAASA